jgi:hypothetical protein
MQLDTFAPLALQGTHAFDGFILVGNELCYDAGMVVHRLRELMGSLAKPDEVSLETSHHLSKTLRDLRGQAPLKVDLLFANCRSHCYANATLQRRAFYRGKLNKSPIPQH